MRDQANGILIAPWGVSPTPALPREIREILPACQTSTELATSNAGLWRLGMTGPGPWSHDLAPENLRIQIVGLVRGIQDVLGDPLLSIVIPRDSVLVQLPLSQQAHALIRRLLTSPEISDAADEGNMGASRDDEAELRRWGTASIVAKRLNGLFTFADDIRTVLEVACVLEARQDATSQGSQIDGETTLDGPLTGLRQAIAWGGDSDPTHRVLGDLLNVPLDEWPAEALKGWLRFTTLPLDAFRVGESQPAKTIRSALTGLSSQDRQSILAGALEPKTRLSRSHDHGLTARVAATLDDPELAPLRRRAADLAAQIGAAVPTNSVELSTALRHATHDIAHNGPELRLARSIVLWMAGPYTKTDGWLLIDPDLERLTTALLADHVGNNLVVSRECGADLLSTIGVLPAFADRWLARVTTADPVPSGWRFADEHVRRPPASQNLATSARCYRVAGRWSFRIPIGPEVMGPRSTVVPAPFATLVGGRRGDNVVVPASVAPLILRWDRSSPAAPRLDSIRELVQRVDADHGDHLLLRCGSRAIEPLVLRSHELATLPTDCHRLCCLVGLDAEAAENPTRALRAVGDAIELDGVEPRDPWDLRLAFVARGEADLASLVPLP